MLPGQVQPAEGTAIYDRHKSYLILLVLPEQDVEGACKAPYCEHQQKQEPFDILYDSPQGIHEGVLGGLQHSAEHRYSLSYWFNPA